MNKNIIFIIGLLCAGGNLNGQNLANPSIQPVNWKYYTKQVSGNTYELHFTAIIQSGWHIYAQQQPSDAIAVPTTIKFSPDSLVIFDGNPIEVGQKEKFEDDAIGISDWQFEDRVDFVQKVRLKTNASLQIIGTILYQACQQRECLKPEEAAFSFLINKKP